MSERVYRGAGAVFTEREFSVPLDHARPDARLVDTRDLDLDAIIAYVEYSKNPDDAGGWGIGHLGPFPEGMVTWFLAAIVLVVTCMAIGKRGARS